MWNWVHAEKALARKYRVEPVKWFCVHCLLYCYFDNHDFPFILFFFFLFQIQSSFLSSKNLALHHYENPAPEELTCISSERDRSGKSTLEWDYIGMLFVNIKSYLFLSCSNIVLGCSATFVSFSFIFFNSCKQKGEEFWNGSLFVSLSLIPNSLREVRERGNEKKK